MNKILLRDVSFKLEIVTKYQNYDKLVRGMLFQPSQKQDKYFAEVYIFTFIVKGLYVEQ